MEQIDALRRQHDAARDVAHRLLDLVSGWCTGHSTVAILMQLNRLHGLLRVHLAHEDVHLYPQLIASPDPEVARIAQRHVTEMGGLAIELECFARRWSCSASIASNFSNFQAEVEQLVQAIDIRIEREDRQLYPLVEAKASGPFRAVA